MDIQRHTTQRPWYQKYGLYVALALFAGGVLTYASTQESAAYTATAHNLAIGKVEKGLFSVTVRGNGTLKPRDIRWVASNVSGRVESILQKAGANVKKGDLVLQLSNPELIQRAEETAWELEALKAENEALKVSLESQVLDQEAAVLNAKMNYESAKINLDAQETLLNSGNATVSRIDHQRSQLETEQYFARWGIEQQRLAKLKENQVAQLAASEARFQQLNKVYARVSHHVESLQVRASMDGVLQEMPLEEGQQIAMGDNIAKLARQDDLIAEIQITERLVSSVRLGQPVVVDTRRNEINGIVSRIDPAVVNGVVTVDVTLEDTLPPEARPELTVDGTISVESIPDTLYVGRPTFAESHKIASVYRINDQGDFAERVPVTFGIGSSNQIQIVSGLNPNDQIILSDSSAWGHLERISIK